jgi:hypothetical protein
MFLLFLLEGRGWMEWNGSLRCVALLIPCLLLLCVVVVVVVVVPLPVIAVSYIMFRFSSALLLSY